MMLTLGEAEPDSERSAKLKSSADSALLESLSYLLDRAEHGLEKGFPGARGVLASIPAGQRLSAGAFAIHSRLVLAMKRGEGREVEHVLQSLDPADLVGPRFLVWPQGGSKRSDLVAETFDRVMEEEHVRVYEAPYDALPPDSADVSRLTRIVHDVLEAIEEVDSATRAEIDWLVSDVALLDSQEINAGTSLRAHGLILLRQLGPRRRWTTYLENLVHETAHLYLFLLWTQDPILENDESEQYSSPLRPGRRPMSAIFHAMFVLARTLRAIRLFRFVEKYREDIEEMSTGYNYLKNPEPFEAKFKNTYDTLREHARLTSIGDQLLESSRMIALG